MTHVRAVWDMLEAGDLQAVKALIGGGFSWRSLHPEQKITPLQALVWPMITGKADAVREHTQRYLELARWMIQRGADPVGEAPRDCPHSQTIWKTDMKDKTIIAMHFAGHSALSLVVTVRKRMQDMNREISHANWGFAIDPLTKMLAVLSEPATEKVPVDASVIELWEKAGADKASHDVTFETATEAVTAHACCLSLASPVLAAMLSSGMKEGRKKIIQIKDSPAKAAAFFVELIYTGSSTAEFDVAVALGALDLAHRWQVPGVIKMLEHALARSLTDETFASVAEAAVLKSLPELTSACEAFAGDSHAIQQRVQAGTLPHAVLELLKGEQPQQAAVKRRRTLY
eukprot:NODE_8232_length_1512_cov_8.294585.p1 GENE.NODE_8232_length_1512_cov_8.294585~~NODE_8232_length_1512_cov_8.294585.p1  ORF type:complete len:344 (-),score=108.42 NODE_8232_length_1512_cov_8.294585:245-1276(-)